MRQLKEALIGKKNERNASSFHNGKWIDSNRITLDELKFGYILVDMVYQAFYVVVPRKLGEDFLNINLHTSDLDKLFIRYVKGNSQEFYFSDPRDWKNWPHCEFNGKTIHKVFTNEVNFKTVKDVKTYITTYAQNIMDNRK